ncbi:MAG TPA: phosphoribosylamine--glycine ligase [Candidatus Limnocylindrales bacterium]|nr:phosphoribosylamine--glycine ligase [Candidatus Limnocylindrales bacterium]
MTGTAAAILVIGGGGREHALCWKIHRDRPAARLFAAPGNGGIGELATLLPIQADDIGAIVAWCRDARPDLVVVGPDLPLALGVVDALASVGVPAFGPSAAAARIESSKAWAADVSSAAGLPMPESHAFDSADAADAFIDWRGQAFVVKADGLALGKGVFICETVGECHATIDRLMRQRELGPAGTSVVLQERLSGDELSVFAITDGTTARVIGSARDHKRIHDGDRGPNTGGMGAFTPVPGVDSEALAAIDTAILTPALAELRRRGCPFVGFLYAGLMLTADGPRVIEFNSRMGDPEAQVLLPLLDFDLVEAMTRAIEGDLAAWEPRDAPGAAVCVVLASEGYPGQYATGKLIHGLAPAAADTLLFHAGTRREKGQWLTAGGRVLGVTGLGATLAEARQRAYAGARRIRFDGVVARTDIAAGAG